MQILLIGECFVCVVCISGKTNGQSAFFSLANHDNVTPTFYRLCHSCCRNGKPLEDASNLNIAPPDSDEGSTTQYLEAEKKSLEPAPDHTCTGQVPSMDESDENAPNRCIVGRCKGLLACFMFGVCIAWKSTVKVFSLLHDAHNACQALFFAHPSCRESSSGEESTPTAAEPIADSQSTGVMVAYEKEKPAIVSVRLSPPRGWPECFNSDELQHYIQTELKGQRVRLTGRPGPADGARIHRLKVKSDDSLSVARRIQEELGWPIICGYALYESVEARPFHVHTTRPSRWRPRVVGPVPAHGHVACAGLFGASSN